MEHPTSLYTIQMRAVNRLTSTTISSMMIRLIAYILGCPVDFFWLARQPQAQVGELVEVNGANKIKIALLTLGEMAT